MTRVTETPTLEGGRHGDAERRSNCTRKTPGAQVPSFLDAALCYARRGWPVHPLLPRSKEPSSPHGCSDATRDEARIRAWWQRCPTANVGINVGMSGLVVVDVDPRNGGDETWRELKRKHGLNDNTVTSLTGGGGVHFVYSVDGHDPSMLKTSLGPGVDVKRGNAYIVVWPSIHPDTGDAYEWEVSGHPDDLDPLALPPSLLHILKTDEGEKQEAAAPPVKGRILDGSRGTDLTSLAGTMRRRGMTESEILAALTEVNKRCDPPKTEKEVARIAKSVSRYEPEDPIGAEPTRDIDGVLYWDSKETPATHDYVAALNSLGYHFRMNVCNDRTEINDAPISDALRAKIRSQMRDLGYRHVNVLEDAWVGHAYDNRFHPVRDFLDGLVWNGVDHLGALAGHFTDTNDYLRTFLRRWLIGAVARAYEPRSCQNRMLVLDGPQGVGKSYFVSWLASPLTRPELFVEGPVIPDDKDSLLRLITTWLWEVSEVGSTTRRSDREALKYFLSMQQVTVRKPYGREDLIKPALASFIGTVNDVSGFLDDPTGYRRFMAVHLDGIDWAYADAVAPVQVWAQAKALYDQGEPWELTAEEAECAKFANEEYEVADPLEDILLRHYVLTGDGGDFTATVDIRDTLNEHGWRLRTPRAEVMAIGGVLKKLGLKGTRRATKGNQERGFDGVKERTPPVNL